jgi:hypothetical protein
MGCPDSCLTQIDRELVNRALIAGPWTAVPGGDGNPSC